MLSFRLKMPGCVVLCGMGDIKEEDLTGKAEPNAAGETADIVVQSPLARKDYSGESIVGKEIRGRASEEIPGLARFYTAQELSVDGAVAAEAEAEAEAEPESEEPSASGLEAPVPPAEWRRFLKASKGKEQAAQEMLDKSLAWRRATLPLPPTAPRLGGGRLPDFVSFSGQDLCGHKVLLLLGAMYDEKLASAEEYAVAMADLVEGGIDRSSEEMMTVLIDTRGNHGWANPRPWSIVSFVRAMNRILGAHFPGRFARFVVFPVPWIAAKVWEKANPLDRDSADSVVFLEGSDRPNAPLPVKLREYLDESNCEAVNATRARASASVAATANAPAGRRGGA